MENKEERFKMGASASAGRESNSPTSTSTEGRVGAPLPSSSTPAAISDVETMPKVEK